MDLCLQAYSAFGDTGVLWQAMVSLPALHLGIGLPLATLILNTSVILAVTQDFRSFVIKDYT